MCMWEYVCESAHVGSAIESWVVEKLMVQVKEEGLPKPSFCREIPGIVGHYHDEREKMDPEFCSWVARSKGTSWMGVARQSVPDALAMMETSVHPSSQP